MQEVNTSADLRVDRRLAKARPPARTYRPNLFDYGYQSDDDIWYRLWNIVCASTLLLCALPVFVLTYLTVLFSSGFPVIYRGQRLGKYRQVFNIYKFRTLKPQAQTFTRDKVLPDRTCLETRVGRVLRESRLDELPQLFNILQGHMNMFGPRPVRPEIAAIHAEKIPSYDTRFRVKPGLLGHAQIFMPHDAPKRLRARYNAILIKRKVSIAKEAFSILVVTAMMFSIIFSQFADRFLLVFRKGRFKDARKAVRSHPNNATVYIVRGNGPPEACGTMLDINDEAFAFWAGKELEAGESTFVLRIQYPTGGKRRSAVCKGLVNKPHQPTQISERAQSPYDSVSGRRQVVRYAPVSNLNAYKIGKYFRNKSFIAS